LTHYSDTAHLVICDNLYPPDKKFRESIRPSWKEVFWWDGPECGVISLASALAIPATWQMERNFPGDLVLFIVLWLFSSPGFPGTDLPWVIGRLKLTEIKGVPAGIRHNRYICS
jgi:NhaP-type Na+/H+ or K+/H+ antiporter